MSAIHQMEDITGTVVTTKIPTLEPVVEVVTEDSLESNPLKDLYPPTKIVTSDTIIKQADDIKERIRQAALLNKHSIYLGEAIHEVNVKLLETNGFTVDNNEESKVAKVSWV